MAKLHESYGDARLDVEGDERTVSMASKRFHLALAERRLKELDDSIATLKPLLIQQRDLKRFIAKVKEELSAESATSVNAVDPVDGIVTG